MKYLKFIIKFSIAAIVGLSTFNSNSQHDLSGLNTDKALIPQVMVEEYTYVRVLLDGVWWIYVYDTDGKLVNRYIEEQD